MIEFNCIVIAVSLLMASMGEAFSVASKLTSTRHLDATSSYPPRRSLASFGSLRDLVDGEDDKSNNGIGVKPRADEFRNLINFSRSKFSDTKFRSRNAYGTGSDEMDGGGLHADRLSAFSFSTKAPKSLSEGAPDESLTDEGEDDATDGPSLEGMIGRRSTGEDDARGAVGGGYYDNMAVDNFNNMVGTFYSKRKFPSREKDMISDAKDERGLHGDRLSTFSFSSNQPVPKKNTPVPENNVDESSSDEVPSVVRNIDKSFDADNFHNLIDVSMSKPSQNNRPDPYSTPDGLDNHADRLSTFSLSSKEDVPIVRPASGGGIPPRAVNHDDRLGTFSFASMDPQSGSTSGRGTSASSPLPGVDESKIRPPQTKAEGGGVLPTKESIESKIVVSPKSPDRTYASSSQKGSLSSIASSVSIKSRNDRIRDIKEATDPRLLHPDGMNVPRLNSKGDVMTLSSTGGRLNIFQRIDKAKQGIDKGVEYESSVPVREGVDDVGAE